MKMIDLPWPLSSSMTSKSPSISCGVEHGGRLIQDENVGVAVERLDDLDTLAHAHRQIFDQRIGIDVQIVAVGEFDDAVGHSLSVEQARA